MDVGDIVEFAVDDGTVFRLAVITGTIGKSKLTVLTETGDEMRPARDEIVASYGRQQSDDSVHELADLRARALSLKDTIDLEDVWTRSTGVLTLEDLARLAFDADSDAHRLATHQAIRDDMLFFKHRKGGWEPREPDHVQASREQHAATEQKLAAADRFVERVAAAIRNQTDLDAVVDELNQNLGTRALLQLVKGLAVHEDMDGEKAARDLLDAVEARASMSIPGAGSLKAFNLMCMLGIWTEHENLALIRFGITDEVQPEVLERAQTLAQTPWEPEPWREDFRDWWTLTIDDASTLDVDDALSLRPTLDGGWHVAIHIADPSARVVQGDILDAAARRRGTSVYTPTGSYPMFPRVLSEGAMSLHPNRDLPGLTAVVHYSPELDIIDWRIVPSIVRVNARLTYGEADALLASESMAHQAEVLSGLQYIADERLFERRESGAVQIELPETRIRVDLSGAEPEVKCWAVSAQSPSHTLIGEYMVLFNELAARFLSERDVPAIYRAQDPPELAPFAPAIDSYPPGFARDFARLKTMRKGEVSTRPARHAGLGISMYLQATSPIRRYGDVVAHRQIEATVLGRPAPYDEETLYAIVLDVERASYEARLIEQESTRYWLYWMLSQMPDRELEAVALDYRDDRRSHGTVLLTDFGFRTTMSFRQAPELGAYFLVKVEKADARRDRLVLRQV